MSKFTMSIDYLPRDIRNGMSGLEMRVYIELCRLFNIRKEVIALEYAHITPSLDYIAKTTNSTPSVISRIITKLTNKDIITTTHRRKGAGEYETNSYGIGKVLVELFRWYMEKKKGNKNHHLTTKSNILIPGNIKDNYLTHFISDLKKILPSIGSLKKKEGNFL